MEYAFTESDVRSID